MYTITLSQNTIESPLLGIQQIHTWPHPRPPMVTKDFLLDEGIDSNGNLGFPPESVVLEQDRAGRGSVTFQGMQQNAPVFGSLVPLRLNGFSRLDLERDVSPAAKSDVVSW